MRMADSSDDVRIVLESAMNSEDPNLKTFVSTPYNNDDDDDSSSELDNSREENKQFPLLPTEYKKRKIIFGVLYCIVIVVLCNVVFFYFIGANG